MFMKKFLSLLLIIFPAILALTACSAPDTTGLEDAIVIITGRYGQGTPEENEMVTSVFGEENSQEWFDVYFNWYNTVHEVGHLVSFLVGNEFNFNRENPDLLTEEQFANAFAVAFWAHFGDEEILNTLKALVPYVAQNFDRPIAQDEDLADFVRLMEAGEIEGNFNNYGWFQFNIVNEALNEMRDLESLLADSGLTFPEGLPERTITFASIGESDIPDILTTVFTILSELGIEMPANTHIYHLLSDDPNQHMVQFFTPEDQASFRDQEGLDAGMTTTEIVEASASQSPHISALTHIWETGGH